MSGADLANLVNEAALSPSAGADKSPLATSKTPATVLMGQRR